jgi:outer membrane protein
MKIYLTFAIFLLFLLLANPLLAQIKNIPDDFDDEPTPSISGSIGAGVGYAPEFVGSNKSKAMFLPIIFLNYGPVFLSPDKGLGVKFDLFQGILEISPAVNYRFDRKESDSELLSGLGDVDGLLTLGGTVALKFDSIVFSVSGFQGMSKYKGLDMDFKASYLYRHSDSFNFGFSVSTSMADKAYNQTFFGITQEQSDKSGYRAYNAQSGFYDVGIKGTFDFFLTPQFSVDVFAGYNHLIGPAADSPIVERGAVNQFSTGLVFLYHFGR